MRDCCRYVTTPSSVSIGRKNLLAGRITDTNDVLLLQESASARRHLREPSLLFGVWVDHVQSESTRGAPTTGAAKIALCCDHVLKMNALVLLMLKHGCHVSYLPKTHPLTLFGNNLSIQLSSSSSSQTGVGTGNGTAHQQGVGKAGADGKKNDVAIVLAIIVVVVFVIIWR
jgi:hypothetical protein